MTSQALQRLRMMVGGGGAPGWDEEMPFRSPAAPPPRPPQTAPPGARMGPPASAPISPAAGFSPVAGGPNPTQHNMALPGGDDPYTRLPAPVVTAPYASNEGSGVLDVTASGRNLNYSTPETVSRVSGRFPTLPRVENPAGGLQPISEGFTGLGDAGPESRLNVPVQQIAYMLERGDPEWYVRMVLGLDPPPAAMTNVRPYGT